MTSSDSIYLFVYGSLRKGFPSPVYHYISNHFEFVEMGKVDGALYDLGEYPAALPSSEGYKITGEIYKLRHNDEFDWAFAQLDDYEGVTVEANEKQLYRREQAQVKGESGKSYQSWIYWYNEPVADKPVVESGDIMEYLRGRMNS